MQKNNDELLTVKQTAARLKMTPVSVYRLINRGDLPAIRIPQRDESGRITRYTIRMTDRIIDDFLRSCGGY